MDLQVCAIKAPGFGESRKAIMQDLAVLTGGQVIFWLLVWFSSIVTTALSFHYFVTDICKRCLHDACEGQP